MHTQSEILERWIEKVADSYPEHSAALRAAKPDPFRNPVGYAIRNGLSQLWDQLLGQMDQDTVDRALDTILRIRAVQDVSPSEAMGFVSDLRPLVCRLPSELNRTQLEARIDQLSLVALDKYRQCREQIVAVRIHETERLTHAHRIARKACR